MPDATLSCLTLLGAWAVIGLVGLARPGDVRLVARVLFPLGSLVGARARARRARERGAPPSQLVLPLGLPDLPFHLRARRAWHACSCSCWAPPRPASRSSARAISAAARARRRACCACSTTCSSRAWASCCWPTTRTLFMVVVGDDGAVVVLPRHDSAPHPGDPARRLSLSPDRAPRRDRDPAVRSACCRAAAGSSRSTRCARRSSTPDWAAVAFLLALLGFGAKAGLVPLHVWLPEAHPAAPSPVSALMSGVMLKTALYGVLRVTFDLLGRPGLVVGARAARARPLQRDLRRGVRGRADRHEAPARVLVDREHRHPVHGRRARDRVSRRRHDSRSRRSR